MPKFLKLKQDNQKPVEKAEVEISFSATIEKEAANDITSDLKFIAESLTASEIKTIRKVCSNTILKKMAIEYAERYI